MGSNTQFPVLIQDHWGESQVGQAHITNAGFIKIKLENQAQVKYLRRMQRKGNLLRLIFSVEQTEPLQGGPWWNQTQKVDTTKN